VLARKHVKGIDWFEYTHEEHMKIYKDMNPLCVNEPPVSNAHIIINVDIFRRVMISADSPNVEEMLDEYIALEHMVQQYGRYVHDMHTK
jgi:hypothetical protein